MSNPPTKSETSWNERFALAQQYREDNGRWPERKVPVLGSWVQRQRYDHSRGALAQDRVDRLTAAGFTFAANQAQWNKTYEALRAYMATNPEPPRSHPELGEWVASQRRLYLTGKLDADRAKKLEQLGIQWKPQTDTWASRLTEATRHLEEHGEWPKTTHPTLGIWVTHQRAAFNEGRLSDTRVKKLNEADFPWSGAEAQWNRRFRQLSTLLDSGGAWPTAKTRLGQWVRSQRQDRRAGNLTDGQIAKLDGIGIAWDPK